MKHQTTCYIPQEMLKNLEDLAKKWKIKRNPALITVLKEGLRVCNK
jgi:hypothetical protein